MNFQRVKNDDKYLSAYLLNKKVKLKFYKLYNATI